MKEPFFSIIVPVYNTEKYLKRCIESLLNQSYKNYEILLINDESKDNSLSICESYADKNKKIKVYDKKNEGLGLTRNFGINHSNGKYVLFIDSDDFIEVDTLKILKEKIDKYKEIDIICFGHNRVNDSGIMFDSIPNPPKEFYKGSEIQQNLIADFIFDYQNQRKYFMSVCMSCFNKKFLKENKCKFVSEREYISEDIYFFIENFKYIKSLLFIKKALYNYYQNNLSLSTKYRSDRYNELKKFYTKMEEIIKLNKYNHECMVRIKGLFISNVMGCLKLEILNQSKIGILKSYKNFKSICNDGHLKDAVNIFNCKNYSKGWKIFDFCIKNNMYVLLYIVLGIKAYHSGM